MPETIATDIYTQKATPSEEETSELVQGLEGEIRGEPMECHAAAQDAILLVRRAISEGRKMNTTAFESACGEFMHEEWKKRRIAYGSAASDGTRERMVRFADLPQNRKNEYISLLRSAIKRTEAHIREVPWHSDAFKASMNEFLKTWEGREGYVGAMLVGSYGSGLQDGFSDIDMYVILSTETKWRERGDKKIGDYLVEYNAHPIPYIKELIEQEKKTWQTPLLSKNLDGHNSL